MFLRLSGEGPLSRQVYEALKDAIESRQMAVGSRLPATRTLAGQLGVSRNLVIEAYERLVHEGYTEARTGAGTFILPQQRPAPLPPPGSSAPLSVSRFGRRTEQITVDREIAARFDTTVKYDFRYGLTTIDEFPREMWRRLISRRAAVQSIDYGGSMGNNSLRGAIADYLQRNRAVRCTAEQIMVVSGSQQALDLCARILLDEGDELLMEDPSYPGSREIFNIFGARIAHIPVDRHGLQTRLLPEKTAARAVYVTPSHQFPTGAVMSLQRRRALAEWARTRKVYIIEDDFDCEFQYSGPRLESIQSIEGSQYVIYVGTFSRALFPGLRLGYLVLPRQLVPYFEKTKWLIDWHTSNLQQEVVADMLRDGLFEKNLRATQRRLAARRDALLKALHKHLPQAEIEGETAGIHVVVTLPDLAEREANDFVAFAARRGVGIYSASIYYQKAPEHAKIILGFGTQTESRIASGIERLAAALADYLKEK